MTSYWIKLYIDMIDDPKMLKLSDWQFRRFIELLLVAKENDKAGLLQPVPEIAWRIRQCEKVVKDTLRAMEEIGVVRETENGWLFVNFAKRQAMSDSAERVKRFREREKKKQEGNVTVTLPSSTSTSVSSSSSEGEGVGGGGTAAPPDQDEPCLSPLSAAFVNATKIPELTGGPPRWIAALETMQKAGVEPIDVTTAVGEMRNKNYSITTLASIVNPAIAAMSKRKTGGKANAPPEFYLPTPSLLCKEGMKLKKQAESKYDTESFVFALKEYETHIKSCQFCGESSTSNAVQAQIRDLANKMGGKK